MIIRLPHVDPIDTLDLTEDFENRVKQSFAKYTEGTSKDYRFEDKLQYIENLKGEVITYGGYFLPGMRHGSRDILCGQSTQNSRMQRMSSHRWRRRVGSRTRGGRLLRMARPRNGRTD